MLEPIKRKKLSKRLPKKVGKLLDTLFLLKEEKKMVEGIVDDIKDDIQFIKDAISLQFKEAELAGAKGSMCQAAIVTKIIPTVEDWPKYYGYIKKGKGFDRFDLLQKRIAVRAVKARWDEDIVIPGTGKFTKIDLSVTKLK